jgi:protein-L-isoaspartate(D-aspartate) O-methyltransferase
MLAAEHIEQRGIRNPQVLRAIRSVQRQEFVPRELRSEAYADRPLDIGHGATISQPYIVAAMTELLEVQRGHKVLEIGTGSGYQAAVLAQLAAVVYSMEVVPELARSAAGTLLRLGYLNVHVVTGDGYLGLAGHAPFDRIILTAAPVDVPSTLVSQLSPGGRLVAPIGGGAEQQLVVLDKTVDGRVEKRTVFPVLFVPMVHLNS